MALGTGTNTDRLFGGTDLRHFIGESADGRLEYLVENSFMNHEVVVFEELFDAPAFILEQLKDILSSKVFRNGTQVFPIKTKLIICNTNRTRESFAKSDASIKALLERFPLDCEVKWTDYNEFTYSNLLNKVTGFADPLLVNILHKFAESGKIVSPRIAINAANLIAECGPSCLKFIAEFNEDKKLLNDCISNYEFTEKLNKLSKEINDNIISKLKNFNIEKDSSNSTVFKALNLELDKKIKELEKLKVGDDLTTKRKSLVDSLKTIYNKNMNSLKVVEAIDSKLNEALDF